jgi:hypothetical protein
VQPAQQALHLVSADPRRAIDLGADVARTPIAKVKRGQRGCGSRADWRQCRGVPAKYLHAWVTQWVVANKTAEPLASRPGDRTELERLTRSAAAAQRARIVLLAADGVANQLIAERVGVSRPTVNLWRARYAESGLGGLVGHRPPGRPRSVDRPR